MIDIQQFLQPVVRRESQRESPTATLQALAALTGGGAKLSGVSKPNPTTFTPPTDKRGEFERINDQITEYENSPDFDPENPEYLRLVGKSKHLSHIAQGKLPNEQVARQILNNPNSSETDVQWANTIMSGKSNISPEYQLYKDIEDARLNGGDPTQIAILEDTLKKKGYRAEPNLPAELVISRDIQADPNSPIAKLWAKKLQDSGNSKIEVFEWINEEMAKGNPVATAEYERLVRSGKLAEPVTRRTGFLQMLDEYSTTTDSEKKRILAAKFAHDSHIPVKNQSEFVSTLDELADAKESGNTERAAQLQARLDKLTYINEGDSGAVENSNFGAFSSIINDRMRVWELENEAHTNSEYELENAAQWFKLANETGLGDLYEYAETLKKNQPSGSKNEAARKVSALKNKLNRLRDKQRAGGDTEAIDAEIASVVDEIDTYKAIARGQENITSLGGDEFMSGVSGRQFTAGYTKTAVDNTLTNVQNTVDKVSSSDDRVASFSSVSKGLANSRRASNTSWVSDGVVDTVLSMMPWTDNAEAEKFKEMMAGSNFYEAFKQIRAEGGLGSLSQKESDMITNMLGLIHTTGMSDEAKNTAMHDTMTNILASRRSELSSETGAINANTEKIDSLFRDKDKLRLTATQEVDLKQAREKLQNSRVKHETATQVLDYQAAMIDEIGSPNDYGVDNPLWPTYRMVDGVDAQPITRQQLVAEYGENALLKVQSKETLDSRLKNSGVIFKVTMPDGQPRIITAHSYLDYQKELKKLGAM